MLSGQNADMLLIVLDALTSSTAGDVSQDILRSKFLHSTIQLAWSLVLVGSQKRGEGASELRKVINPLIYFVSSND